MDLFKKLLPVIAFTFLILGCGETERPENSEPELVTIDTLYQFMDFEDHGISRPGSIAILPNGNIAVADGQIKKITIVTPSGDSVAQFGKEGRGPAEFIYPGNLTVASGLLNVVDANQFKVLEFDLKGNFVDSYGYESKAMGGAIALSDDREFFTGANGENDKLIKWGNADADTSHLFGEAKVSMVEDMDIKASRNAITNGRIPDYFKNNVILTLGEDHLYAFLNSYSELRKYTSGGELVWEEQLALPDNEQLKADIAEAANQSPNFLPFLTYLYSAKVVDSNIYLLSSKARNSPQHLTKVNSDGQITAFYKMPHADMQILNFAIHPDDNTIYVSDARSGIVYKGNL
ncbi:MAG: 6-bladed beta-propeller [Gracilimonas sp.]|nr:6-bladed beta-propeller [Gracilimonas sp.]